MAGDGTERLDDRSRDRRDALLKEYGEVASTFRLLTDIRFKLLAFLPIAAAAAVVLRGTGAADATTAVATLGLAGFGLTVTVGLLTYNARNDQLYNELVGRAADIERSVGLPDGAFAHRPNPWLSISLPGGAAWRVDHGNGVGLIYAASIALWLFLAAYSVAQLAFTGDEPAWWAAALAGILSIGATWAGARRIGAQRRTRSAAMRAAAAEAVRVAEAEGLSGAASSARFITSCGVLSPTTAPADLRSRAGFYSGLEPERLAHYIPEGPPRTRESYYVALIVDLPPRWVFDCATGRRGHG